MKVLEKLFGKDRVEAGDYPAKFRCVKIHPGPGACAAVLEADGQCYFPDEIPRLPLDGCGTAECQCSYELKDDRRAEDRESTESA